MQMLWSGEKLGIHFDLYYNKYPFVELHCLLVPERENCLPQFHLQEMHTFIWQLVKQLAAGLPGLRIGYNALGAFASVNHLHYQLFVREQALPVGGDQEVEQGRALLGAERLRPGGSCAVGTQRRERRLPRRLPSFHGCRRSLAVYRRTARRKRSLQSAIHTGRDVLYVAAETGGFPPRRLVQRFFLV